MKVLLLSTSYIESTICDNIDIYFNIPVTTLYLLKENHMSQIAHATSYDIIYVDDYYNINVDIVYIVYDALLTEALVRKATSFFTSKGVETHMVVSNSYINKFQDLFSAVTSYKAMNLEHSPRLISCQSIEIYKPTILICGISDFNQQLKIEIVLDKLLRKKGIKCCTISHYQKYADEFLDESILSCENSKIDDWVSELIQRPAYKACNIVNLSLPYDIRDEYIYNLGKVESMIKLFKPNYIICCISRDKEYLCRIDDIRIWFSCKYGRDINAFFISAYETNKAIEQEIRRPMRSTREVNIDCQSLILTEDNDDYENILFEDIIIKTTMPQNVDII